MSPPPRPAGEAIDRWQWNGLSREFKLKATVLIEICEGMEAGWQAE